MKMSGSSLLVSLILALLLNTSDQVCAEQVVVGFKGTVWLVDDALCQCMGFEPGETLVGYYSFDSDTPDADPDPQTGEYQHHAAPYGMVVWVAQHEFRSDSTGVAFTVWIVDSHNEPPFDAIIAYEDNPIHSGYVPVNYLRLDLHDDTGSLLEDDSLVLDAPVVSEWTYGELVIMGEDFLVRATIEHMYAGIPSAVSKPPQTTPSVLKLGFASPNPLDERTTVNIELNTTTDVNIEVFDITGRLVYKKRINGIGPGSHRIPIRLLSQKHDRLPSGVYVYRVRAGGEVRASKLVVVR